MNEDKSFDIIAFELIKSGLSEIAEEMMTTLYRTGRSVNTTQALDCSAGLADAEGQLLVQALALPGHLGTFPGVMEVMFRHFGKAMRAGDVYVSNDPYSVGLHLPDVVAVRPLFMGAELVGFALSVVHHVDVGGLAAGGMPTNATEVYHEGLRIPPLKLYDRGRLNATLIEIVRKNVRVPDKVIGDLKGQAAACFVGQKRMGQLVAAYGSPAVRRYGRELLDYTERMTRSEVRGWRDGTYRFTDYVDDDGMGTGPIAIRVALTVRDDSLLLDFAGTDAQVKGSINCPLHSTRAGSYTAIRCVMSADLPTNSGFFRPISVSAPAGTLVNPVEPAATCNRGLVLARVADAVFGALAQVVPERTPACSEAMVSPMTWSARDPDGTVRVWVDNHMSGRGGTPRMDAQEGVAAWVYNANNTSVEVTEANFPLRVTRFGFLPSSGGAGKYRGGLATYREFEVLAPEVSLTFRSDRRRFRPWGLMGGGAGRGSDVYLIRNGKKEPLPAKFTMTLRRGNRLHSVMQSGGGYGDPLERDPDLVLRDYLDEKIDVEHARSDYGVVLDEETGMVKAVETERLRRHRRAEGSRSALSDATGAATPSPG
jgi:N-methylhydantoinase B